MRILLATSDWKWTGPAQPMVLLGVALRARGHDVVLACPESPDPSEPGVADRARAAGLSPAVTLDGGRGIHWRRDQPDARRLRDLAAQQRAEVIHVWHTRDHGLALRATSIRGRGRATAIVRSLPTAARVAGAPWNRWLLGPGCDGLHCVSPRTAESNAHLRGKRPLLGCLGAVDLASFSPPGEGGGMRAELGIPSDAPVVGIVARVQRHRRFDLLFDAFAQLAQDHPTTKLLILGRGTHFEEVAARPVEERGIADRVVFGGYRRDDYIEALRSMDVVTFLVPGSDGGCRALLEAAACGVPAVATRRGALPEVVVDGRTGRLVDESPAALAEAWRAVLDDPELRLQMGTAARQRALYVFSPARFASDLESLYRASLEAVRSRGGGSAGASRPSESSSR